MDFQDIFDEYYTQYRGDSDIPAVTDPEWAIAVRFGNMALKRWAEVDGEEWPELWTTAVADGAQLTWTSSSSVPVTLSFTCPDNMRKPGGWVKLTDPVSGSFFELKVLQAKDIQFQSGYMPYAYFVGDPNNGFTLNITLEGNTYTGWIIDFPYYKKPTMFVATKNDDGTVQEDGTTITECPDPNFITLHILARRFYSSRNYPSYQIANRDAEEALKNMQIKAGIGTEGDTWAPTDLGGVFGS